MSVVFVELANFDTCFADITRLRVANGPGFTMAHKSVSTGIVLPFVSGDLGSGTAAIRLGALVDSASLPLLSAEAMRSVPLAATLVNPPTLAGRVQAHTMLAWAANTSGGTGCVVFDEPDLGECLVDPSGEPVGEIAEDRYQTSCAFGEAVCGAVAEFVEFSGRNL